MKVKMINSVGEYAAGEEYDLDDRMSDRFLAAGYAEGEIAGDYTVEEWDDFVAAQQAKNQTVGV
jgi:predicted secreted acid phosphatase